MSESNIIASLANEEYHAHPNWSNSNLTHIYDLSPFHAHFHKFVEKREPTPAMENGIAIHSCTLEHEAYLRDYVVFDGRKFGKKWDEFQEEHQAKRIITKEVDSDCKMIREAVLAHRKARYLVESAKMVEPSAFAEILGLPCKSRPDIITVKDWMVDLKSTQIARPDQFSKSIENYNYDRQAAFHHDIWVKANGGYYDAARLPYLWIAVESSAPFGVSVIECIPEMFLYGRRAYQQLIEVVQNCMELDTWPCYSEDIMAASYPPWSKRGEKAYE